MSSDDDLRGAAEDANPLTWLTRAMLRTAENMEEEERGKDCEGRANGERIESKRKRKRVSECEIAVMIDCNHFLPLSLLVICRWLPFVVVRRRRFGRSV